MKQPQNIFEKKKEGTPGLVPLQNERQISPAASGRIIIGILLLIVLIQVGFFNSYIRHFPNFEDYPVKDRTFHFNAIMHFHGMIMMGWILMLLVQPILILKGRIKLHRWVGSLSYVFAPLVVLAIYLANRDRYNTVLEFRGQIAAVQGLAVSLPQMIFFPVLYLLAIYYRDRPALHMRFMCSTAFLFINPALDRALKNYLGFERGFPPGIIIVLLLVGIIAIVDSLRTKRISPFTLVFGFFLLHKILWELRDTPFWHAIGNAIVKIF